MSWRKAPPIGRLERSREVNLRFMGNSSIHIIIETLGTSG